MHGYNYLLSFTCEEKRFRVPFIFTLVDSHEASKQKNMQINLIFITECALQFLINFCSPVNI
jgi:hypothetical protein